MDPLKRFFECLTEQERLFHEELAEDNLGILLRSAVNEVDWYLYNYFKSDHVTFQQQEHVYLLTLGITRLVKVALESREQFDVPVVMFRRTPKVASKTLELLAGLGMIEHGRRIAQSVAAGVCQLEELGEKDFLISLPSDVPDDDFYEREVGEHYRRIFLDEMVGLSGSVVTDEVETDVRKKLDELVFPFLGHFIGYGADPLLDEYFFGKAYMEVMTWDGMHDFPPDAEFGGVTFASYTLAVALLVSLAKKHQGFAEALVRKNPEVELHDILTITADREGFVGTIRDALTYFGDEVAHAHDCTPEQARTIFEVLSVDRGRTAVLARPGAPLPPLICCSGDGFIRFQAGATWSGSRFLLESLKDAYPREYSRNQQLREKAMQRSIQEMLGGSFAGLIFRENIRIKLDGKTLTDIDLVIGEEETGLLVLCQLKHQDPHGIDLHARRERDQRLCRQVGSWLGSVECWIAESDERDVRAALRLPKGFPDLSVRYAAVARYHASALRRIMGRPDGVCLSLPQLLNAIHLVRASKANKSLSSLLAVLKMMDERAQQQMHAREEPVEWRIRELRFEVRHSEPEGGSAA